MTFSGKVTVFLILAIAFQAMCQDCGEAGNTGDGNAECPPPEIEIDVSQNFCIDVYKAIESYFQEEDPNCIVLFGSFNNATRGTRMCQRTMNKLMIAARRTDVNATINTEFCDGPIRGFSAKLNGDGLKWVCGRHKRVRIDSVSLDHPITIGPPISVDDLEQ